MAINFTTILPGGDFETFSIPHNPEDGSLQGRLLLAVDAAGRLDSLQPHGQRRRGKRASAHHLHPGCCRHQSKSSVSS